MNVSWHFLENLSIVQIQNIIAIRREGMEEKYVQEPHNEIPIIPAHTDDDSSKYPEKAGYVYNSVHSANGRKEMMISCILSN